MAAKIRKRYGMSRKSKRQERMRIECPRCSFEFETRNKRPKCSNCGALLKVTTNPHLQVEIRRNKGNLE